MIISKKNLYLCNFFRLRRYFGFATLFHEDLKFMQKAFKTRNEYTLVQHNFQIKNEFQTLTKQQTLSDKKKNNK